jgi:hypothetical protein
MKKPRNTVAAMPVINVKEQMPSVPEALSRMSRGIEIARARGHRFVKLIHGYGSTGVGGDIRIALQAGLQSMIAQGQIKACIYGENWARSDRQTWTLLGSHPALKQDGDLGKNNSGITVVIL